MEDNRNSSKENTGLIIGLSLGGGLLFILLLVVIIVLCVNLGEGDSYSQIEAVSDGQNHATLQSNVYTEEDVSEIKKNFVSMEENDGIYTLHYKNDVPALFESMNNGDVFVVYPGENESLSYFSMGFCGKYISTTVQENDIEVQFSMPQTQEVFSDIYIDTSTLTTDSTSFSFAPSDGVEIEEAEVRKADMGLMVSPENIANAISDEITLGSNTMGFSYTKTTGTSLDSNYLLLCDRLKLNIKNKAEGETCDFTVSGSVTLENPAIKYVLDYTYDENTDEVDVSSFDLGFISQEKVDITLKAEKEVTIKNLLSQESSEHILDITDVTDDESGKIILGTYIIGVNLQVNNPITGEKMFYNETNKISYMTFGIAIQATLTASGKLSLEYNFEESGFIKAEVNSEGENSVIVKGYDYPNPIVNSTVATAEQENSTPETSSKIKGEMSLDVATGVDVGLCILGLVPMKLAINCPEVQVEKSIQTDVEEGTSDKTTKIIEDSQVADDDLEYLMVSVNGNLKLHLGSKIKLGDLIEYTLFDAGARVQVFKRVILQYPVTAEFNHSQCGFGNIYVGESYTDDELESTYKDFLEENGINDSNISLGDWKESLRSEMGEIVSEFVSSIGEEVNGYKVDYYSGGVIFLRDASDKVVSAIITNDEIINSSGYHTGLSAKKTEQMYSAPDESASVSLQIGSVMRSIFDFDGIEDMNITQYTYYSKDSDERMDLLFTDSGNDLAMIVISTSE